MMSIVGQARMQCWRCIDSLHGCNGKVGRRRKVVSVSATVCIAGGDAAHDGGFVRAGFEGWNVDQHVGRSIFTGVRAKGE